MIKENKAISASISWVLYPYTGKLKPRALPHDSIVECRDITPCSIGGLLQPQRPKPERK